MRNGLSLMIRRRIALFTLQTNGTWGIHAGTVMLIPIKRGHMEELGTSKFIDIPRGCSRFILGYSVTNDFDDIYFTFNFTGQFLDPIYLLLSRGQ